MTIWLHSPLSSQVFRRRRIRFRWRTFSWQEPIGIPLRQLRRCGTQKSGQIVRVARLSEGPEDIAVRRRNQQLEPIVRGITGVMVGPGDSESLIVWVEDFGCDPPIKGRCRFDPVQSFQDPVHLRWLKLPKFALNSIVARGHGRVVGSAKEVASDPRILDHRGGFGPARFPALTSFECPVDKNRR